MALEWSAYIVMVNNTHIISAYLRPGLRIASSPALSCIVRGLGMRRGSSIEQQFLINAHNTLKCTWFSRIVECTLSFDLLAKKLVKQWDGEVIVLSWSSHWHQDVEYHYYNHNLCGGGLSFNYMCMFYVCNQPLTTLKVFVQWHHQCRKSNNRLASNTKIDT